jgi:hypothetical protein
MGNSSLAGAGALGLNPATLMGGIGAQDMVSLLNEMMVLQAELESEFKAMKTDKVDDALIAQWAGKMYRKLSASKLNFSGLDEHAFVEKIRAEFKRMNVNQ